MGRFVSSRWLTQCASVAAVVVLALNVLLILQMAGVM